MHARADVSHGLLCLLRANCCAQTTSVQPAALGDSLT